MQNLSIDFIDFEEPARPDRLKMRGKLITSAAHPSSNDDPRRRLPAPSYFYTFQRTVKHGAGVHNYHWSMVKASYRTEICQQNSWFSVDTCQTTRYINIMPVASVKHSSESPSKSLVARDRRESK